MIENEGLFAARERLAVLGSDKFGRNFDAQ